MYLATKIGSRLVRPSLPPLARNFLVGGVRMGSMPAERRVHADSVCIIGAGPSGLAAAK